MISNFSHPDDCSLLTRVLSAKDFPLLRILLEDLQPNLTEMKFNGETKPKTALLYMFYADKECSNISFHNLKGAKEIIEPLIACGASINDKDELGKNLVHYAANLCQNELVINPYYKTLL